MTSLKKHSATLLLFIQKRFNVDGNRSGDIVFLGIVGLLIFSSGFGLRDPWPADEPRFALIAKEMVESGDWFFPRRGGELYPDKPPLFMWAIALFYLITGSIRIAFLLPSLLAGLGALFLVYDLGCRLWHRRVGLFAGLSLLMILQFPLQAKGAQIDMSLCFWTTLGLYGLLRHLLLGPAWRWYNAGWFAMGIGVITKGVGFLPVFVFIPYIFCRLRKWRNLPPLFEVGQWRWLTGPLFFLGAICLWFLPMMLLVSRSNDPALVAYKESILWHQTAKRYVSPRHHIKPVWYYIVSVIPWIWLPLNIGFPWYFPAWRSRILRRDSRYFILLGWILLVLIFFSASPGKRGVYLLPISPALAMVTAPLMSGLFRQPPFQKTAWYLTLFLSGFCAILGVVGGLFKTPLSEKVNQFGVNPWGLSFILGIVGLMMLFRSSKDEGIKGLALFFLAFWLLYGWIGYPLFNPIRSPAGMMMNVSELIGPEGELSIVNFKEQFILHADRSITHFGYHQPDQDEEIEAARWLREKSNRWVVLPEENLSRCFMTKMAIHIGYRHRRNWFLINQSSLRDTCLTTRYPVSRFTSNQVSR